MSVRNISKQSFALTVAGLTMIGLVSLAHAQPGSGPVAKACAAELAEYCADKPHGQGEARACLVTNKDKVSEACRTALDTTGPGRGMGKGKGRGMGPGKGKGAGMGHGMGHGTPGTGPVATACKAELEKYCADKPHVRGEARACLVTNKDKVSEACRTALDTTGHGRGMGKGKGRGMGAGNGAGSTTTE